MFFLVAVLAVTMNCCAMDPFGLSRYSKSLQEQLINAPMEISLEGPMPVYIACDAERKELEKVYGEKFSLNTIFIKISWVLPPSRAGMEISEWIPAYVPYDYIKGVKENGSITLTMGAQQYNVVCRQRRRRNFCSVAPFHDLLQFQLEQFAYRADYFNEDEVSLIRNKIIDLSRFDRHGENASSYIIAYRESRSKDRK